MSALSSLPSRFLAYPSRALPRFHHAKLILRCTMSSSSLTHSFTLPSQPTESVNVSSAAGVSSADFRNAIDSCLFKNWLRNLESETGILADGTMTLKQVVIQGVDMFGKRIGFLKFKAEIFDKETGQKVLCLHEDQPLPCSFSWSQMVKPMQFSLSRFVFLLGRLFWNYLLECWMMIKVTLLELQFVRWKRRLV